MPTPFMHLYLAQRLREQLDDGSSQFAAVRDVRELLRSQWPAFCLGNVAPDFQVLFDVPRETTHFYRLPPAPGDDALAELLACYPQLKASHCHSAAQAVFVSGYLSHLHVDLVWFREVLLPYFVEPANLGGANNRMLLHNLTLMLLDQRCAGSLSGDTGQVLRSAELNHWLPFAADDQLGAWRDYLAEQLEETGTSLTVEIYAQRMSIPAEILHSRLNSVEWLDANLLDSVPVSAIESILEETVGQSLTLVHHYLAEAARGASWRLG